VIMRDTRKTIIIIGSGSEQLRRAIAHAMPSHTSVIDDGLLQTAIKASDSDIEKLNYKKTMKEPIYIGNQEFMHKKKQNKRWV